MKSAKGPRSLHSPFSAPGLESLSDPVVPFDTAVIDGKTEARELATRNKDVVGEASMLVTALGIVCSACVTSSGNDMKKDGKGLEEQNQASGNYGYVLRIGLTHVHA